jgi:bifunctional ADP-heptose synthase (sugar kinase/adenylyltransferase)
MRTQKEVEDYLDVHLSKVLDDMKKQATDMDPVVLSGYITGYLMSVAVQLAVACVPRHIAEEALKAKIRQGYEKK